MKHNLYVFAAYAAVSVGTIAVVRNVVFGGLNDRPVFWIRKYDWGGPFGLIATGDSRTYRTIETSSFSDVVRKPANFAFSGLGYSRTYREHVDRLIDHKRGSVILLGITPSSLTPRSSRANGYVEVSRMKPLERRLAVLTEPIGSRVEAISVQDFIASSITALRRNKSKYIQDFRPDGFVASDRDPRLPDKNLGAQKNLYANNKVSSELVGELLGFVKTWRSEGIRVFAYWPPASPAVTEIETTESGFDKPGFISELEHAGGEWIEVPSGFETYDGNHLTYDSAKAITAMIKTRIAERLGTPGS